MALENLEVSHTMRPSSLCVRSRAEQELSYNLPADPWAHTHKYIPTGSSCPVQRTHLYGSKDVSFEMNSGFAIDLSHLDIPLNFVNSFLLF